MDALDDERSRSGYAPTTPLISEHEDSDLLVPVPPELLSVPTFNPAQGNLEPATTPSPFASPTPVINQVDARTLQQAVLVNQDRSGEVAQMAELRHQAIMSEAQSQFQEEAKRMREDVERQARDFVVESSRASEQQAHEQLRIAHQQLQQQHEDERKKMLTQAALERHENVLQERSLAQERENSLRAELAEQARIIKELREGMNSAPGNRMSGMAPEGGSSSSKVPLGKVVTGAPPLLHLRMVVDITAMLIVRDHTRERKRRVIGVRKIVRSGVALLPRGEQRRSPPSPSPSDPSSSDADSSSSSSVCDKITRLVKKELKKMLKKDGGSEKETTSERSGQSVHSEVFPLRRNTETGRSK